MKAEKFNYTATETMHYHCPCCAAEWQTNKLPYCPNCEVKIQYATQSPEPNTVTEPYHKEAIELVKKYIPNNALAKEHILESLQQTQATNTVTEIDEATKEEIKKAAAEYFTAPGSKLRKHDFELGAEWAITEWVLQQTQAVGVSEKEIREALSKYEDVITEFLTGIDTDAGEANNAREVFVKELLNQKK